MRGNEAVLLSAALLLGIACSSEGGGPRLTTVGADLENASNTSASVCVRVPVLLGSQVVESKPVANAFKIEVLALRHNTTISFPGALNADLARRKLSLSQLTSGYSEVVSVIGADSVTYDVRLHSGCSEVLPEDP